MLKLDCHSQSTSLDEIILCTNCMSKRIKITSNSIFSFLPLPGKINKSHLPTSFYPVRGAMKNVCFLNTKSTPANTKRGDLSYKSLVGTTRIICFGQTIKKNKRSRHLDHKSFIDTIKILNLHDAHKCIIEMFEVQIIGRVQMVQVVE